MNSFELNKVLGAILGCCLIILALNIAAGAIFAPERPAKPGFAIAVKQEQENAGSKGAEAQKPSEPIEALLASASADRGKQTARQCQACHTFEKGGPNRVGPNLWNIVGSPRGEDRGGFAFSDAMKKKGGKWTYDELNKFLTHPQGYIPGTKMTFAGLPRDKQRADVIAFLRTQSDSPVPLPKAAENKPAAGGNQGGQAPAGGGAKQNSAPQQPQAPKAQ
ncbi:MAG TPA: cytochrome c family protein [Pseudolabrys sp.]|nr:cytochrome c family protein [Pseudolabrys sp.]